MPERTQRLPVLPLTQAVVLPRMSATIPVEGEDARNALEAAQADNGLLLLLPKVEGRYSTVGVIASHFSNLLSEPEVGLLWASLSVGAARMGFSSTVCSELTCESAPE